MVPSSWYSTRCMAAASANFRIFFAAAFLTGCNHSPLSSAAGWRAGEWPSDQQVTQGVQDESRRAGLEKLASMANADSRLWTVTPKLAKVDHGFGVEPTVATAQDLPPPRAKEYRALFSQLALPEGWVAATSCFRFPSLPPAEETPSKKACFSQQRRSTPPRQTSNSRGRKPINASPRSLRSGSKAIGTSTRATTNSLPSGSGLSVFRLLSSDS
jgi:hypothetical protein